MPALQEFHHSTLYLIRAETAVTSFFVGFEKLRISKQLKLFPVPCSLFPVPCHLFPYLRICVNAGCKLGY
ncbi:MAG: hypothetical protein ACLBM4_20360 [Dolichospermum sp.]